MLNLALLVLVAAAPKPIELPDKAAVFAVGQDPVAKTAAGRVELELTKALKKKGVNLVDVETQFAPPPLDSASEEGDKLFTAGKEAYDNLDMDAAAKSLTSAALFFIKKPSAAKPETLAEIFLFLGASEFQNGAKADAQKEFTRALQMNPALAPDAKYFGADVQKAFAASQKAMGTRPKGKLSVVTDPGGAEVEAFGLSYGMTPVPEIELPAGRYMVRLKRPGFAPSVAFPDLPENGAAEVNLKLQGAPLYMIIREGLGTLITRANFDAPKLPPTGAETGKDMQARYLVLASVTTAGKGSKVELQVWNVNTGDRLKGVNFDVTAEGGAYDTGAEAVSAWISHPGGAVAAAAAKPAPAEGSEGGEAEEGVQPSEGGSVLTKWWLWTAVGVVVVGAGVTTGAVVASQPHGRGGFNTALGQP